MADDPAIRDESLSEKAQPALRWLDGARPLYILPADPLADEVLIPGFQAAAKVDCMVGFFSSEVLASLAPGLATYIGGSENTLRLIVSPLLRAEDRDAIEHGLKSPTEIADRILEELTVTEDLLQRHTLKCLSWLLRQGRIAIKVALMTAPGDWSSLDVSALTVSGPSWPSDGAERSRAASSASQSSP